MTKHNLFVSADALEMLNYIVSQADNLFEFMEEQHAHRHELSFREQAKLDDILVLSSTLCEFADEYLRKGEEHVLIARKIGVDRTAYWTGLEWTNDKLKARKYQTMSTAQAVITRHRNETVDSWRKGDTNIVRANVWAVAHPSLVPIPEQPDPDVFKNGTPKKAKRVFA